MNERGRIDVLKCVTVTHASVQDLPSSVKRKPTGPLATQLISVQSVQPFSRYGEGMHNCIHAHVQLYSPGTAARETAPNIIFRETLS